jgi:outer membrane lipopolysaccharide assembly protein LptE/RlpB
MGGAGLLAGALLAVAGCHARAAGDVPAALTQPTAESRAELERVVGEALNRSSVTLAADALVADGVLVVDRAVRRDAQGRPLQGRETGRPERFRLVRNGADCVLVHEASGRRFRLKSATCSPR